MVDIEKVKVKFLRGRSNLVDGELILFEEVTNDEDVVMIEITVDEQKFSSKNDNFFLALQDMRIELERNRIQIICNGAARNIYPSAMQMSMGVGRKAYKLYKGQQARMVDVVDIFECDESLDFVSVEQQSKFYGEWIMGFSK